MPAISKMLPSVPGSGVAVVVAAAGPYCNSEMKMPCSALPFSVKAQPKQGKRKNKPVSA
ncbi:MAG TPA: hypothetical protein VMU80_23970 [Bryobacteraceae bacterium]|nr:hypothetical protein [Bryobacteraceae bacterium]